MDIENWEYTDIATYDEATGLYTPFMRPSVDSSSNRGNLTWVTNDGSVTASSLKELFTLLYTGWSWGFSAGRCYTVPAFTFDGLGHTITGYTDNYPFFRGNFTGTIRNLTLEDAYVEVEDEKDPDGVGYGYYQPAILVTGSTTGSDWDSLSDYQLIIENVHINNSKLVVPNDSKVQAGLFIATINGAAKTVYMNGCSAVDSHIISDQATAQHTTYGLIAGYLNTTVDIENTILANCSIVATNNLYYRIGMTIGHNATYTSNVDYSFDNVAVVNCKVAAPNASASQVSVLTSNQDYKDGYGIVATNIYAFGNTVAAASNGEATPMTDLTAYVHASANYNETHTFNNIKTDAGITHWMHDYVTAANNIASTGAVSSYTMMSVINDMNTSADHSDWGFGTNGSLKTLAEGEKTPVAVSFTKKDGTTTYYTDVNGKLVVTSDLKAATAEDLAALGTASWSDGTNAVEKGADWSAMTFAAAAAYTKTSHDLTYTAGENKTHSVVCDLCDEHAATGVACTPVADPENDVAATYFAKAQKAYKCEFCTNTWTEEAADSTHAAPYTIALDDTTYTGVGSEVKLTIAAKEDAKISAMKLSLTVSEYLDYVSYAPSTGYMVTVNEKADGTLRVILAKENGTLLTAEDVATLTFVTKALPAGTDNAELTVDAALTETVVGTGDATAKQEALTKTASVKADYSVFTFVAGDVDHDNTADLLDAVLMIQKLNGTIGADQNAAFQLIAADVNNSGNVDTADIVLMLQYCTGFEVELVNATQEPTIVVVE